MIRGMILISTLLACLSSCGPKNSRKSDAPAPSETNPTPLPTKVPGPNTNVPELEFSHEVVLREFANGTGGIDRAALFILKSSVKNSKVTEVRGPSFLGNAQVGVLSTSSMEKLFTRSDYPLRVDEKSALLSKYEGDTFVYFENYNGELCAGPDYESKLNLKLEVSGQKIEASLLFSAIPTTSGSCTFIKKIFLTAQNASSAVIIAN
jgi:hypothetical protein